MSFDGFAPDAVALLEQLPMMSTDEYAAVKPALKQGVVDPGAALIADVAEQLDADLTVVARSSVSPLHRDLRFVPEGAPRYKDHLLLTTWEGDDKRSAPTLWIRIDPERVGVASGIAFSPAGRDRWRVAVGGDQGEALATALDRLLADRGAEVAGDQLKRVPQPFDQDHPRADLLRRTGFQVRYIEPLPDSFVGADFVGWCADRLDALLPVHRWMIANLTDRG